MPNCELAANLDFCGKKIPPIGCDKQHPFCGTFDGKGYKIKGFVLSGKGMAEIGFFGFLKGSVSNLSVDGIIKADNCPLAAGFCAVNEGEIHCCEAVVELHAKRNVGMFVGENNGLIERCSGADVEVYRSGRIPVGYHIENLTLDPPDGITLTAGIYDAKMVFSFYHHDTGEKGMIDSTVPVAVEIE